MKNIVTCAILVLVCVMQYSCSKTDDYAVPAETLAGNIIDSVTGQSILTEQPDGIRLKMLETSWSDNPIPWYFWVKNDGTFNNTKVFRGTYLVTPVDGPFFPVEGKTVDVKGITKVDFTVVPFLNVSIAGKLEMADTTVTVNFGISRAKVGFKILDARVFVSNTPYVSNGSFDNQLTPPVISLSGTDDDEVLSTTYSVKVTKLKRGRTYYIKVGARTDDNISKRYNYSEVQQIDIP